MFPTINKKETGVNFIKIHTEENENEDNSQN